ncbi:unnamed protein product [Cunninghamella blakesleeana]
MVAGLGIDFKNRRRNKVAGSISKEFIVYDKHENKLGIHIETNESLGNCPKYITIRDIYYKPCSPTKIIQQFNSVELPNDVLPIILQSSTIFLATKYLSNVKHMGLNHRGGEPGFVRYKNGKIYIPDYSGNRYFSSLGNIENDPVAGVLFLDFNKGDLLQVTGMAKNIYGDDANAIMKNQSLITEITITGFVYIGNGLPIRTNTEKNSPYNPSISFLSTEKDYNITNIKSTLSQLDSVIKVTPTISTFHFTTSSPISYKSGQHIILDFSSVIVKKYQHMNDDHPQWLNDNLIRSWTITSHSSINTNTFSITVRKQSNLSKFLHMQTQLSVPIKGVGGNFLYDGSDAIFIAAGIGITPFISFLKQENVGHISLLFSLRNEDLNLRSLYNSNKNIDEHIFITDVDGRMQKSDIEKVSDYKNRPFYVCGPLLFMNQIFRWAQELGISQIYSEDFSF